MYDAILNSENPPNIPFITKYLQQISWGYTVDDKHQKNVEKLFMAQYPRVMIPTKERPGFFYNTRVIDMGATKKALNAKREVLLPLWDPLSAIKRPK